MKVKEYLEKMGKGDVTFIKARARKDAHTPFYHPEYQTTPIWCVGEWLNPRNESIHNHIVLNDKQPSITWLSGADWNPRIEKGWLKCLLIISEEDAELLHVDEDIINFIDGKLDL